MQPPASPLAVTRRTAPWLTLARGAEAGFHLLWAASVLVPVVGFLGLASLLWQATEAEALARAHRSAGLLAVQVRAAFEIQEAVLTAAVQRLRGVPWEAMPTDAALHEALRALDEATPSTAGLNVVAPNGRQVVATRYPLPTPPLDLSDRDYVRMARRGGGTYVSAVFVSRPARRRLFVLSHAVPAEADRSTGGVVASAFEEATLSRLGGAFLEEEGDLVTLIRDDGDGLARQPERAPGVLRTLPSDHPLMQAALMARGHNGVVRARSGTDGLNRHLAFTWVPDYPVFAVYGLPQARVRAAQWRALTFPAAGAAAMAGLLLLLTGLAQAAARRRRVVLEGERQAARLTAEVLALEVAGAAGEREAALTRAELEARLRQAEKGAALGELAAGVAHDFSNVVQAVHAAAGLLRKRSGDPAGVARVAGLLEGVAQRGRSLTRRMTDLARREHDDSPLDLAEALQSTGELLAATLGNGLRVRHLAFEGILPQVRTERGEFEAVLVNLAANARDAMPQGGDIVLSADVEEVGADHQHGLAPGRYVSVRVRDGGTGMDPATLARVGEMFFTTKAWGKGTGLGIAMARTFAARAGGALGIDSVLGEGTTVTLWLRAVEAVVQPPAN